MARIVRGQVLALKSLQFVSAARALGQSKPEDHNPSPAAESCRIITVYLTLTIPAVHAG